MHTKRKRTLTSHKKMNKRKEECEQLTQETKEGLSKREKTAENENLAFSTFLSSKLHRSHNSLNYFVILFPRQVSNGSKEKSNVKVSFLYL